MKELRTIKDVLSNLRPGDCRRDFWERLQKLILTNKTQFAATLLKAHSFDCDYDEQCLVFVNEVTNNYEREAEQEHEGFLKPAPQSEGNGFDY